MKRERALQVVLLVVGLFYSFWGYLLFDALWHPGWLNEHNDVLPMFLSLNTVLGPCLLLAVKQPAKYRLMIAYGAWSSLAHGFTMTIVSAQAAAHGMHRRDSPQDIGNAGDRRMNCTPVIATLGKQYGDTSACSALFAKPISYCRFKRNDVYVL